MQNTMSQTEYSPKSVADTGHTQQNTPLCKNVTFDEAKCVKGSTFALDTDQGCLLPVCLFKECEKHTPTEILNEKLKYFHIWNPGSDDHCSVASADIWEDVISTKQESYWKPVQRKL